MIQSINLGIPTDSGAFVYFEIAAIISAVLVFISSCATLILTAKHGKKNKFIETITVARRDYIKELRKWIAEFCFLVLKKDDASDKTNKLIEISIKIKLLMDPAGFPDRWDGRAVALIHEILKQQERLQFAQQRENVYDLLALMQSWFILEWHGFMAEGKEGILTKREKERLRHKYWNQYKRYKKKERKRRKKEENEEKEKRNGKETE
jgi:hypothetical protein